MDQTRAAVYLILGVIIADPQSASYPNLSYQNIQGPVASVHPTGSPYALPILPVPINNQYLGGSDLSAFITQNLTSLNNFSHLNPDILHSNVGAATAGFSFDSNYLDDVLGNCFSSPLLGRSVRALEFYDSYPFQDQNQQQQVQHGINLNPNPNAPIMPCSIGQPMTGLLRTLFNLVNPWSSLCPILNSQSASSFPSQPSSFYSSNVNNVAISSTQQQQHQAAALLASFGTKSQDSALIFTTVSSGFQTNQLPLLSGRIDFEKIIY